MLDIYSKLLNGEIVNKYESAKEYGVNERSIQRDLDDIRSFLEDSSAKNRYVNTVIYDRAKKGFRLDQFSG